MGRAGLLALVGLAVCGLLPTALGKVIEVVEATDGTKGTCPGAKCDLRAAWGSAQLGDTILLTVDPHLSMGPLESPMGWNSTRDRNGTVTLMGPASRGAVIKGGTRFLTYDGYPYRPDLILQLVIKNIEFTGFSYPETSNDKTGGILCIASDPGLCSQPYTGAKGATAATQGRGLTGGNRMGTVGENDTRMGNWSQLREDALLVVENCVFRDNNYTAGQAASYGSMISILAGDYGLPILINGSQFMNNSIFGVSSVGSVISTDTFGSESVAVMVLNSRFTHNRQGSLGGGSKIPSDRGPVIGAIGPVSISGSSFVGNTMGPCRAVVTSINANFFHVYIYDTEFIDNEANTEEANDQAALVIGGWIVMHRVTAVLPASVPPIVTLSPNDQYMHECALVSSTGKAVEARGYQIYNRNPTFTNLVNGTGSLGFADCGEAAAWLPCRPGTECSNLHNPHGQVVGYSCNQ